MKAIFMLENGFDASTGKLGQGGLLFGKKAWWVCRVRSAR